MYSHDLSLCERNEGPGQRKRKRVAGAELVRAKAVIAAAAAAAQSTPDDEIALRGDTSDERGNGSGKCDESKKKRKKEKITNQRTEQN